MPVEEGKPQSTPVSGTGSWGPQVEALLEDWHHRVYAAQTAHYASADRFRTLNYIVGVPAVILSSVVGTSLFAGLDKDSPRTMLVASTSILAAILGALQTFLRFAERATLHATAADWYSAIRRDIEEILHLPVEDRGTPKDCLDEVRKEMNRAAQDSPELSARVWEKQAKRFGVKEPQVRP
jgi:hypothetical protein